jgi:hypothetical protein
MAGPVRHEQAQPISEALDAEIRKLAVLHRADAFDNVDLDKMLMERPLSVERARWFARRMMKAGRRASTYADGQAILSKLEDALLVP